MRTVLGIMVVVAGVLGIQSYAHSHAICTDGGCCSPHGQTFSSTGCQFSYCASNGVAWTRNVSCPPYSTPSCDICSCGWACGTADVYVDGQGNHVVNSSVDCYGGHC
jgi:hypothetical protein